MRIVDRSFLVLVAVLALIQAPAVLFQQGCANRTLDPSGVYAGDKLLFEFDGVIVETTKTFQEVVGLADRNAVFVQERPDLAAEVMKIRSEIDGVPVETETLVRMHRARDAYLVAKGAASEAALRKEIATARTLLETARALLPLFVQR